MLPLAKCNHIEHEASQEMVSRAARSRRLTCIYNHHQSKESGMCSSNSTPKSAPQTIMENTTFHETYKIIQGQVQGENSQRSWSTKRQQALKTVNETHHPYGNRGTGTSSNASNRCRVWKAFQLQATDAAPKIHMEVTKVVHKQI